MRISSDFQFQWFFFQSYGPLMFWFFLFLKISCLIRLLMQSEWNVIGYIGSTAYLISFFGWMIFGWVMALELKRNFCLVSTLHNQLILTSRYSKHSISIHNILSNRLLNATACLIMFMAIIRQNDHSWQYWNSFEIK